MYWLYFFLFIAAIATPIVIEGEAWHLTEDMRESTVILFTGAIAFILYILKEKSLLRHVREKLWFQQKNTAITKDLSQSYSYIGEVNRKLDIIKDMMQRLVVIIEKEPEQSERILWEILDTVKQLTQAECVSMRIFTNKARTHQLVENGDKKTFAVVSDEQLLANKKNFFEIDGIQGIASHQMRQNTKIFLLLLRKNNEEIDEDIVGILLAFLAILETFLTPEKK